MPYTSVMLFWFELQVSIAVLISRVFFFFISKLLYLFLRSGHDGGEQGWPWHDWSVQGHQAVVEHLVLGDQFLGHVAAVKIRKRNVYHSLPQTSTKSVLFTNIWIIIFFKSNCFKLLTSGEDPEAFPSAQPLRHTLQMKLNN